MRWGYDFKRFQRYPKISIGIGQVFYFMQELFWTLGSGSGGALASNVSSEFAGNAGWFKIIQVFTKP